MGGMSMDDKDLSRYQNNRKLLAVISIAAVLTIFVMLTLFICRWLTSFSTSGLQEYIQSFGIMSWLVFLVLQFLQVFIALIPGEILETAAGFAFGPMYGTVLCYIGMTGASILIFYLTRKFGVRIAEVFTS